MATRGYGDLKCSVCDSVFNRNSDNKNTTAYYYFRRGEAYTFCAECLPGLEEYLQQIENETPVGTDMQNVMEKAIRDYSNNN